MPTPSTANLPAPKDWNEFEDLCADLFSREWGDRNAGRYGRQGQRQNGVDIYGVPSWGGSAGVQCKGRSKWPPRSLSTNDIDDEVEKAKAFKLPLTEFTIATIAPDDAKIQDHVREITERQRQHGLFSVHVIGWGELIRRLTQHADLVEKYYGFVALSSLRKEIQETPEKTATVVVEQLQQAGVIFAPAAIASSFPVPSNPLEPSIIDAAERDLTARYNAALRRSLFPEASPHDEFERLAAELVQGAYAAVSAPLRRMILLRGARNSAVQKKINDAEHFLAAARTLAGDEPETVALARLAEARGNVDVAIRLLRDRSDPESRAVLLTILHRNKGPESALQWFTERELTPAHITASGLHILSLIYVERGDFPRARDFLAMASEGHLTDGPYLFLTRGAVRLACLFPKPERVKVLHGRPVDVRFSHTIPADSVVASELDLAISDFNRLLPIASELQLDSARRVAQAYIVWSELLHPTRRDSALTRMRAAMLQPSQALQELPFAFAFDHEFDPAPIRRYLERREEFGGLDDNELLALLVLHLHGTETRSTVEFIARYRIRLKEYLDKQGLLSLEIQALAKAGDVAAARRLLNDNLTGFDQELASTLEAEVGKAEGADPVAEYQRAYQQNKTPEALRALIGAFADRKDHHSAALYAERLYGETEDPRDITFSASAFANAGDLDNFKRVVEQHPLVLNRSNSVASRYAWLLFRLGRLQEARGIGDRLRASVPADRDLNLEIALAIETGEWELLAQPLEAYREHANSFDGEELIRAANLAQTSGQGAPAELIRAAIRKNEDNPHVLIGAYSLAIEQGAENSADIHEWFRRALELSGPDGPVQAVELKELFAKQSEWNEHTRKLGESVVRGELPLSFAATGLRTTHVDVVLRNLVRNASLSDPRRRVALPLFSGRRKIAAAGEFKRVAFDISAILVLGWLGLLPKAFDTSSEIVLPGGALLELFEGRRQLRHFQRSRLRHAELVRDAILRRKLKLLPRSVPIHDPLAKEIGGELASLLYAAERLDGVVLRPAPVHRLNQYGEAEADMTPYAARLSDMQSLLATLKEEGVIDQATETTARRYFELQDKKWPSSAKPALTRPLLLDGLALNYLQTVNLLDTVLNAFDEVYVDASAEEEASTLIEYDKQVEKVVALVEDIRVAVRNANTSGKIIFGPRRPRNSDFEEGSSGSSTVNLLSNLLQCEAVVFDDRMLNGEAFASDSNGHRARTVTSLEIIEELFRRGRITADERRSYRHRLRTGGAMLVPIDADEIEHAVLRNEKAESKEFRAIRENIDLARIAELPRFPTEIPWLASFYTETKAAVFRVWLAQPQRAAALAESILQLRPRPEDWVARWDGTVPPNWVPVMNCVLAFGLTMPVELSDRALIEKYNEWLEHNVLEPLRNTKPSQYRWIVEHLRSLLVQLATEIRDEKK